MNLVPKGLLAAAILGLVLSVSGPTQATPSTSPAVFSASDAGYAMTTVPARVSASVRFVLPTVSCSTGPAGAQTFLGIIVDAPTVGLDTAAVVEWGCNSGSASFSADLDVIGSATTVFSPKPGDVIVAKVFQSSVKSQASLTDLTQGSGVMTMKGAGGAPGSVLLGIERGDIVAPVPTFSSPIPFSGAKIDGTTPSLVGTTRYDMIAAQGAGKIFTSQLSPAGKYWTERMATTESVRVETVRTVVLNRSDTAL